MTYDAQKYHRRSLRLKRYNYSQAGAYFVTICAQDRVCLFGEAAGSEIHLNDSGLMIRTEWYALPCRFNTVELDEFVIMPNHLHGILLISNSLIPDRPVGAGLVPAPGFATDETPCANPGATTRVAPTIGDIVGAFKSLTTVLYMRGVKQSGWPGVRGRLWQRNYHEHVIRNDQALNRIRQYILDNPASWASDPENPEAQR